MACEIWSDVKLSEIIDVKHGFAFPGKNIREEPPGDILLTPGNFTSVEIEDVQGTIQVHDQHVMGFLEVLDRRRYELELIKGSPERFKAASRRKIEG